MGYTKEKADKLIKEHEQRAKEYEEQAKKDQEYETFDNRASEDLKKQAQRERDKADGLRALNKHWEDAEKEKKS